jgi:hypothetical protein
MEIHKYRIIEWTSVFKHGPQVVEYELQSQSTNDPNKWNTLGTSLTLDDARRALLFHAPHQWMWAQLSSQWWNHYLTKIRLLWFGEPIKR